MLKNFKGKERQSRTEKCRLENHQKETMMDGTGLKMNSVNFRETEKFTQERKCHKTKKKKKMGSLWHVMEENFRSITNLRSLSFFFFICYCCCCCCWCCCGCCWCHWPTCCLLAKFAGQAGKAGPRFAILLQQASKASKFCQLLASKILVTWCEDTGQIPLEKRNSHTKLWIFGRSLY